VQTFTHADHTVHVNDTSDNIILSTAESDQIVMNDRLGSLVSLSNSVRRSIDNGGQGKHASLVAEHDDHLQYLLRDHAAGKVLFTPKSFTTGSEQRVSNRVAERILSSAPLGISLLHDLRRAGVNRFVDELTTSANRVTYTNTLNLILAGLAVSTNGAGEIGVMPREAFLAWIAFFRDNNGARWKTDLWNSGRDVAFQCLREIALAYGRLTGYPDIAARVVQKRSDSSKSRYWQDLQDESAEHLVPWLKLYESWRGEKPAFARAYRQMFMHLIRWLGGNFDKAQVADVVVFLATPDRSPTFAEYLKGLDGISGADAAAGKTITYLTHANAFSDFIAKELAMKGKGRAIFPFVSFREIEQAKNAEKRQGRGRLHESSSRPLPPRLSAMTRAILEEGEHGWPGSINMCREELVAQDGSKSKIYCPVLPTLFLSLFDLPLRVGQMKRFDSGEGDLTRFDGNRLAWETNHGPAAGYWDAKRMPANRGYAYSFDGTPPFTGFFVNTNKTGQPYLIPWENEALHRRLYELRLWQEMHNPVAGPIPPSLYVDDVEDADEGKLEDYPDIFALFRLQTARRSGRQGAPPNIRKTGEFWQLLMAELERRLALEANGGPYPKLVKRQEKTGQAYAAKYNPHGLRVAGLTMMLAKKIPIEIISKLIAGHKSILMTLYYMKFEPSQVNELLSEARLTEEAAAISASMQELRESTLEQARSQAAVMHQDGLEAATAMDSTDKMFWVDTCIGFCPWDGTRCHDGGKVLRKFVRPDGKNTNTYAPVEGGERNCVLCRHFISGPAWRNPLWLHGSKLTRHLATKATRVDELQARLNELVDSRDTAEGQIATKIDKEIETLQVEVSALSVEQATIGAGIYATQCLLEACEAIEAASSGTDGTGGLIAQPEHSIVEYLETSNFEQAAILTAAGRVYPMIHDVEAEAA